MAERGSEHLLLYGADRAGSAIPWLTRWPVTREALVVHTPGEQDLLLVNFYNHVPNARRLATEARVEWAGRTPVETALAELRRRGGLSKKLGRLGVMGPLPWRAGAALTAAVGEVVDLGGAYANLRLVKSEEEIAWLRVGCELTDRAVAALAQAAAPGVDERELGNAIERAYVGRGGTTHIHYLSATPMGEPAVSVPAQWPSTRALRRGDALTCEISASFWDHPGQVLRTFAIAEDPPPLYRRLHEVAEAAFDALLARLRPGATAAELVEASSLIGEAGFTTRDDLVHGFVGGYLPPVLGDASRILEPVPDFTFEAGMTVVIQPNVVTPDERAGVQTGELVLVTAQGAERLHSVPGGLRIAAAASSTASTIAS
jgi:Xaa-Pro dipeptidase